MSTYAGYQRYEVPNLGAVAASTIDKMTERDEKQKLLDKQLKYKQDLAAAKDAKKLEAENKKEEKKTQQEDLKDLDQMSAKSMERLNKVGDQYAENLTQAGTLFKNKMFDHLSALRDWLANDPNSKSIIKEEAGGIAKAIETGADAMDKVSAAMSTLQKSNGQYDKDNLNVIMSAYNPSSESPVQYEIQKGGNVKILTLERKQPNISEEALAKFRAPEDKRFSKSNLNVEYPKNEYPSAQSDLYGKMWSVKNEIDISQLSNPLTSVQQGDVDFEKQEDLALKIGKQESALGGVNQKGNPLYQKERDALARRISNGTDAKTTYDGVYRYIPTSGKYLGVVSVQDGTSQKEIDEKIKKTGYDKDDVFVMKYKVENNMIVPMLDEKQQAELEKAIKSHIDSKAEFKHTPERSKGDKETLSDTKRKTLMLAAKGDPDALNSVLQSAIQKGNITFAEGKDLYIKALPGEKEITIIRKSGREPINGVPTFDKMPLKLDGSDATITNLENLIQ